MNHCYTFSDVISTMNYYYTFLCTICHMFIKKIVLETLHSKHPQNNYVNDSRKPIFKIAKIYLTHLYA